MLSEYEIINGIKVPEHYAEYWRNHPEIGMPASPVRPDGSQLFDYARLDWHHGRVIVARREEPESFPKPTI